MHAQIGGYTSLDGTLGPETQTAPPTQMGPPTRQVTSLHSGLHESSVEQVETEPGHHYQLPGGSTRKKRRQYDGPARVLLRTVNRRLEPCHAETMGCLRWRSAQVPGPGCGPTRSAQVVNPAVGPRPLYRSSLDWNHTVAPLAGVHLLSTSFRLFQNVKEVIGEFIANLPPTTTAGTAVQSIQLVAVLVVLFGLRGRGTVRTRARLVRRCRHLCVTL